MQDASVVKKVASLMGLRHEMNTFCMCAFVFIIFV